MVKVVWDVQARNSLRTQIEHIKEESLQTAEKVRVDIFELIESLATHPEKYPVDKFKSDITGNWRAFEKHGLRVAYYVTETEIRIIRVRHVRQGPRSY